MQQLYLMHTDQEAVLQNSILWPISVPPRSTSSMTTPAQTKEICIVKAEPKAESLGKKSINEDLSWDI